MSDRTSTNGDAGWTEKVVERLRMLWAEGHSTAEIGRRMGLSKNAIVGKAHRLQLPSRESPIRRDPGAARRPPAPHRAARAPTLPPLTTSRLAPLVPDRSLLERRTPPVAAPRPLGDKPCCWPIGEPGQPGFRFCEEPAEQSSPYCPAHAALAYVRPRVARPNPWVDSCLDPFA